MYVKHVTNRTGHFWPPETNFEKKTQLGRGAPDNTININIKTLGLVLSDKNSFMFPILSLCKSM